MERSTGTSKVLDFLGEFLDEALCQLLFSLIEALPALALLAIVIGLIAAAIWVTRPPKSEFEEWLVQSRKRERLQS